MTNDQCPKNDQVPMTDAQTAPECARLRHTPKPGGGMRRSGERGSVLECGQSSAAFRLLLMNCARLARSQSGRGLPHSKTCRPDETLWRTRQRLGDWAAIAHRLISHWSL